MQSQMFVYNYRNKDNDAKIYREIKETYSILEIILTNSTTLLSFLASNVVKSGEATRRSAI